MRNEVQIFMDRVGAPCRGPTFGGRANTCLCLFGSYQIPDHSLCNLSSPTGITCGVFAFVVLKVESLARLLLQKGMRWSTPSSLFRPSLVSSAKQFQLGTVELLNVRSLFLLPWSPMCLPRCPLSGSVLLTLRTKGRGAGSSSEPDDTNTAILVLLKRKIHLSLRSQRQKRTVFCQGTRHFLCLCWRLYRALQH